MLSRATLLQPHGEALEGSFEEYLAWLISTGPGLWGGLLCGTASGLAWTAYIDAGYANTSNNRRSVSGKVITLGGAAVSWASSTQMCVTLPTAEEVKEALLTGAVLPFI